MNENTLDPPGSIAILMDDAADSDPAGDAWGVELMLYARYLGFHAKLFAPASFATCGNQPESELGLDRAVTSPLGLAALAAQKGLGETMAAPEITDVAGWYKRYLQPLVTSDLIGDHIETGCTLDAVDQATATEIADADTESDDDDDVPPDFVLRWRDDQGQSQFQQFEAVIDARMGECESASEPRRLLTVDSADYYFSLGRAKRAADEQAAITVDFVRIRTFFAELTDRPGLDVYANLGGFA